MIPKANIAAPASQTLTPLTIAWGLFFAVFLYLAALPVDAWPQFELAWSLITVLFFLRYNKNWALRMLFLLTGVFITLRYLFWRTCFTLEYQDIYSFPVAIALYLAELYGIIVFLLGVFVNINPRLREPEPLTGLQSEWPSVDILIPTYNEDIVLLRNTVIAARQIRYPKERFNVFLCDDGGTVQKRTQKDAGKAAESQRRFVELQELCQQTGAIYVTREKNFNAKAGNINSALKQISGELVLILDADHIPTVDFLEKTVGLFQQDPKLFLVQTPHFFLNPDPLERNLDTFHKMPSENEMFYSVIQPGLDYWNAAFFCGSAAVLRRSCLDLVGGISGQTITEDAETALTIHSLGYRSAYIRYPLIAGLSPETFSGFIVQRVRWAQGMVQIFLLKNPLLQSGLTIPQRLCYFNSCFFWFFGYARLVFALAPVGFLVFGLKIYRANVLEFCAFALPHVIGSLIVSDGLFGRVRWTFISELYELIQCVFTVPATIKVFFNPLAPKFAVTPKGEQLEEGFISSLATPFYFLFVLTVFSMAVGGWRAYEFEQERGVTFIVLGWSLLNLIMVCAALGVVLERKQRRAFPRMSATGPVRIHFQGQSMEASLDNVSAGGAAVCIPTLERMPDFKKMIGGKIQFEMPTKLSSASTLFNCSLRNIRPAADCFYLGLEFAHQSHEELSAKVSLVFGDSDRWLQFQNSRGSRKGIKSNLAFLIKLGFIAAVSHFVVLARDLFRGAQLRIRRGLEMCYHLASQIV